MRTSLFRLQSAAGGFALIALASALLASCGGGGGTTIKEPSPQPVQITPLSNRADLVSGGEVLIEISSPSDPVMETFQVSLNGTDVSRSFVRTLDGRLLALISGLKDGDNVITAVTQKGLPSRLTVTNSPRSGPVFSGAQVGPFYCATPTPQPASGNTPQTAPSGLSGQPDANCNIPTEFKAYYRTTLATPLGGCPLPDPFSNTNLTQPTPSANQCWKPYFGGTPSDMAPPVTTDTGVTVPFVVRLERGTINRGIYDIAVLFDPARGFSPDAPQPAWNRNIYYSFGSSTGQPRRQVRTTVNWTTLEEPLRRGFLVAQNSMTDSSRNSNRVLMAETTMMMKEHIIETYGEVKYTLGTGCSGGSINANMNLSIMPGTLDGVITTCTYPDSESTALEVGDCTLLVEAYQKSALLNLWTGMGLSQAEINARKAAINGHPDHTGCVAWFNLFGSNGKAGLYNFRHVNAADLDTGVITQDAARINNCELPNSAVYDPANPVATANLPRCNAWSWAESIWGRAPGTPAARDTRDNVGVQYGLSALAAGKITAEEFVTLNEAIGGIDRDSTPRAQRSTADPEALEIAYRSGIVASGANLSNAAILDLRGWDDSLINLPPGTVAPPSPFSPVFGIHHQWFSFAIRDRIERDARDRTTQAMWRFARGGMIPSASLASEALTVMDGWLNAVAADHRDLIRPQKVRANRPDSSHDFCILSSDTTQSTRVFDQAICDADPFLKPAASPRQVAGGPRTEDVLKCQLKPLSQSDYQAGTFTPTQFARLQAVFPGGVCDWSQPGVGQQAAVAPLTFRAGPGGVPLGAAPVSTPQ